MRPLKNARVSLRQIKDENSEDLSDYNKPWQCEVKVNNDGTFAVTIPSAFNSYKLSGYIANGIYPKPNYELIVSADGYKSETYRFVNINREVLFIAGKMVGRVKSARFVLYGSFARTYHGHGTDRALVGGILGYHPDDERIRDSFHYAEEAGIEISFEENFTDKEVFPNTVDIYLTGEDGDSMSLRGESIGGGNAVITRLNGVEVELTGNYCTMVVQHVDKKGTLAFVTTVLSAYDLNIGSLRLYRESRGKIAYAIIELDANVPEQVVNALKGIDAVINVLLVPAIHLD